MRRRSRELNIFSMSALDLFASALGAFILITLILMPYYLRQKPVPPVPPTCPICPPVPASAPAPVPVPAPEPEPVPAPAPKTIIMDKLIMINMQWAKKTDIDLHVYTPDGHFYYDRKIIDGKPGNLIHDDRIGGTPAKPSKEIWVVFEPAAGKYKICFDNYSKKETVAVWGQLLKPTGPISLGKVTLTPTGSSKTKCVLQFNLDREYNISNIRP